MSETPVHSEPRRMSVILDGPQIDALGRHHRREATRLTKAGKSEEAAHHAQRADVMLATGIAMGLPSHEPPPVYLLDERGFDQHGAPWGRIYAAPGVQLVPLAAPQCVALWRSYDYEAGKAAAAGNKDGAAYSASLAERFLQLARAIDPVLGELADNHPTHATTGWT